MFRIAGKKYIPNLISASLEMKNRGGKDSLTARKKSITFKTRYIRRDREALSLRQSPNPALTSQRPTEGRR